MSEFDLYERLVADGVIIRRLPSRPTTTLGRASVSNSWLLAGSVISICGTRARTNPANRVHLDLQV